MQMNGIVPAARVLDILGSRRSLLKRMAVAVPALVLARSGVARAQDEAPAGIVLGAASATADAPFDGRYRIDGRTMHIYGIGAGGPSVILEAGYGDDWTAWRLVQPAVAPFARVFAYDRAALGESDPAPASVTPRTAADAVADLRALLEVAGIPGPYLLVGASYGGLVSRLFASSYPDDVAGLVLVDAVHEDYFDRLREIAPEQTDQLLQILATIPEGIDFAASGAQIRAAGPLPAVPAVVLARGRMGFPPLEPTDATEALWQELQRDLATRVPGAQLLVADHSGHSVHMDQPDAIVAAIRQVVDAA